MSLLIIKIDFNVQNRVEKRFVTSNFNLTRANALCVSCNVKLLTYIIVLSDIKHACVAFAYLFLVMFR